jgi:hypothetical protein
MIDQSRHVALRPTPWASNEASAAIDEIISDALAKFDPERFWPAHPLDDVKDGHASVYMGAAGMIWALDYLSRVGATKIRFNFGPSLAACWKRPRPFAFDRGRGRRRNARQGQHLVAGARVDVGHARFDARVYRH